MAYQKWRTRFPKKLFVSEKTLRNSRIGVFEDADFKNEIKFANFKTADQIFKKIGRFRENLKKPSYRGIQKCWSRKLSTMLNFNCNIWFVITDLERPCSRTFIKCVVLFSDNYEKYVFISAILPYRIPNSMSNSSSKTFKTPEYEVCWYCRIFPLKILENPLLFAILRSLYWIPILMSNSWSETSETHVYKISLISNFSDLAVRARLTKTVRQLKGWHLQF